MIRKYIPGSGPLGAKLMVIQESPTEKDTAMGKYVGSLEMDQILKDAGISRHNVWHTALSKYHIPPSSGPKKMVFHKRAESVEIDLNIQIAELQEEINQIKPNCILGFGKGVLWGMNGKYDIQSYRGSIMVGMGSKFIPTYNPNHLSWRATDIEFKGYWNRQVIIFDCKRASLQSATSELSLPQRTLEICRNSAHLAEFLNRYKDCIRLAVDIEASGMCIPVCIGLSFNKQHGMTVPLWNVEGMSTIPDADMVQIWILLAQLLYEKEIVGQNFNYDRDKLLRLGFGIKKLRSDLMLKAQAINPELPKGLAFNTSIYTLEPFYKNEGMYHGSITDLFIGCARDACVTLEVDENMDQDLDEIGQRPFYEKFLMELPDLYWGIEQQGFRVDTDKRHELLKKYVAWDENCRYELFRLTGTDINVYSSPQVQNLLYENWKLPFKKGASEEDITELLNSPKVKDESIRRGLELILEDRRVRKSISTYLMALPDFDNRMRTTYFPCLDTGRSSTGQQDPPIRPTVEVRDDQGKKKDKPLGIAFQTMTKHGDIGADIRGMYVPDEYHLDIVHLPNGDIDRWKIYEEEVFIQADSAQAEARVIFLLADDEEALRDIDARDYHALTASWFFGGTENDYSKKVLGYEHPIRFVGKTLRHAGHLGAGPKRAAISVNTDARKFKIPITVDEKITKRALEIFHTKQPRIQKVFQFQVVEQLKRTRTLIAPAPFGFDIKQGGRRTFFERWGEELFRQAFSYIPQRAISDNTKGAGIRIKRRIPSIKIVMESHDALLFSIPISKKAEWIPIIKEEMERPIDFSYCSLPRRELIIPCEIEIGKNYADMGKFKEFKFPEQQYQLIEKTVQEEFHPIELPKDTQLDETIYRNTVEFKPPQRSFIVDE